MPSRIRTTALAACLLTVLAAGAAAPAPAAATTTDCATSLWTAGTGGYASYRIPAVVSAGGVLVAFAEGRRNSSADNGDIEVVERRSTDGGCTWTPTQVVSDAWTDTVDNPVPMVTSSGGLVLVTDWQRGTVTQADIQAGIVPPADGRRIFVQASSDDGATWSARREITSSVKDPSWLWYATGPGHGQVIERGLATGRLVVAADHSQLGPSRGIHTLLSDDGGRTWRIGAVDDHDDGVLNPDETTIAELPDARLYVSSRNQGGSNGINRGYTYSTSSGSTFTAPVRPLPTLTTPVVEGSVLQDPGLPTGVSCAPLLYSGPQDPSIRQGMAVRRSDDDGLTWTTIAELTDATTPAAYSDEVKISRTQLGVAFETGAAGPYEQIAWRQITLGCP